MAKQELFKIPVLRSIIRYLGAFPVKRGTSDKKAIRIALERLSAGEVVLIFPEGTRSKTGQLGKGFSGSGFLALKVKCTVIPTAIVGRYRLFSKVKIFFGPPIYLDDLRSEKAGRAEIEQATERIMEGIRKLLVENQSQNASNGTSLGNSV
jgi:1-acyl-sn-glycerol-3-phosphate acyltransferase